MKNMLKDAGILFVITLIAGLLLGVVYQVTKEPIKKQEQKAKNEACKEVFETAETFEAAAVSEEIASMLESEYAATIDEVNVAKDTAGNTLGYVITVTDHEGYGGDIQFAMGIQNDGTVNGLSFLSISETAGLGMRAEEVLSPQFENKKSSSFQVTKNSAASDSDIDAISGATITSNAVVSGVNAGLSYYEQVLKEGGSGNE